MRHLSFALLPIASLVALTACGEKATLPVEAGMGPNPQLPAPNKTLFPTVNIAEVDVWPKGTAPTAASGLTVYPFATGLSHPRWLLALPDGGVLVAEASEPPKPDDGKGIKGWIQSLLMKKAGSKVPSANRITLLRDNNGDGVAETRSVYISGVNSPFGMALVGSDLYVAATDAILRFPYVAGASSVSGPGVKLVDLPGGRINHHWTKNVIAGADGTKLYATVGSNSNVAEKGMAAEEGRAAIWEIDRTTGKHRIFASGLRNPNGMILEPTTATLFTVVNERDEIGSDLVPDYLTSVKDGGFYGWPYSYYGQTVDERVKPQNPALVARAIKPDYALGTHTASLGLTSSAGAKLAGFGEGVFIGQHGSWNRKPASGYKVIFVPFAGGKPSGAPVDVLTGFLGSKGEARGRPVGVIVDKGSLLVADDVGNRIWRVSTANSEAQVAAR